MVLDRHGNLLGAEPFGAPKGASLALEDMDLAEVLRLRCSGKKQDVLLTEDADKHKKQEKTTITSGAKNHGLSRARPIMQRGGDVAGTVFCYLG